MSFFERLLLAFAFIAAVLLPADNAHAQQDPEIRVLIAENQKILTVTVKGPYKIYGLPSLQILKSGNNLWAAPVTASEKGLKVGTEYFSTAIRIEPAQERELYVNKSRFRGRVDIGRSGDSLNAINRLGIEGYLYGVLPREVASWWPMEALKAQAIAARTYALYQASVSQKIDYDVKSSTSSQVYGGSSNERFRTNRAVEMTKGQVLAFEGKIFPTYFHSVCAGLTAAADELWKISMPPLSGKAECHFCKISPHYQWQSDVPLAEIEEKLVKNGRWVGQILAIEIITQTPSHRVGSLKITGTNGETTVAAKDFRIWVGGDRLRSTRFTLTLQEDGVKFKGNGWGHGVGLCQWGTLGKALLGRKHQEILAFYYPQSEIKDNYGTIEPKK